MTHIRGTRLGPLYEHEQRGDLIVASMVAGMAITMLAVLFEPTGIGKLVCLVTMAILGLCTVAFYKLKVIASDREVLVSFGPGWIHTRFDLSEITECEVVRNPWYYGWGIHYIGGGWLYNVSGFEAVELRFRDGSRCRIGTDDPHGLHAFLESQLPTG